MSAGHVTAQADTESVSLAPVELEIVPRENEPTRRRRGRPLGSRGSQIARVKRRLALLVVSGKRTIELAKAFGVSTRTVRAWLADSEVQQEISTVEQEFLRRTERQFMGLFRQSIASMEQILKHGGNKTTLRAIEMVWTAVGRLPPKGARITMQCNHRHVTMDN